MAVLLPEHPLMSTAIFLHASTSRIKYSFCIATPTDLLIGLESSSIVLRQLYGRKGELAKLSSFVLPLTIP